MTETGDPKVHFADMGRSCEFCPGRSFRRSRLQGKDVPALLLLHLPVRCLHCSQRQTVPLAVAMRAFPSSVRQVRAPKEKAAWNAWEPGAARAAQGGPTFVGGAEFPPLPMRPPAAMPELQGIKLQHITTSPSGQKSSMVG